MQAGLKRNTLRYSQRIWLDCVFTVPLKSKLPPLVSFLARRVSFLARRVSFLARRVSFLARRVSFLARRVSFLARRVSFLSRRVSFLARRVSFLARRFSQDVSLSSRESLSRQFKNILLTWSRLINGVCIKCFSPTILWQIDGTEGPMHKEACNNYTCSCK